MTEWPRWRSGVQIAAHFRRLFKRSPVLTPQADRRLYGRNRINTR